MAIFNSYVKLPDCTQKQILSGESHETLEHILAKPSRNLVYGNAILICGGPDSEALEVV